MLKYVLGMQARQVGDVVSFGERLFLSRFRVAVEHEIVKHGNDINRW